MDHLPISCPAGQIWHQFCLMMLRLRVVSRRGHSSGRSLSPGQYWLGGFLLLSLLVQQRSGHLAAGFEYRQVGQKCILCLQLRNHVGFQCGACLCGLTERGGNTPIFLFGLDDLLPPKRARFGICDIVGRRIEARLGRNHAGLGYGRDRCHRLTIVYIRLSYKRDNDQSASRQLLVS